MLKPEETRRLSGSPDSAEAVAPRLAPIVARSPLGVVHCFVEPDELRRLLSIMAGTELVPEMIQSAIADAERI